MKPYTYRISDSYIILITSDANFSGMFLDYFTSRYGAHNRRGFAKVFATQNFYDALLLFDLQKNGRYIIVIDNNIEDGDAYSFFAQVQDKLTQQLMLFYDDPKELKAHKRIFESEIFLILLKDTDESLHTNHFIEHTRAWHLQKPVALEEIDKIISSWVFVEAQWLRNPITYLPSWILIDNKIKEVANSISQTSFYVKVVGFNKSKTKDDSNKQIEIMHFIAEIIEQSVEEQGDSQSWIGHAGGFDFFIVIEKDNLKSTIQRIQFLFENGIQSFYSSAQTAQLSLVFHSQYNL